MKPRYKWFLAIVIALLLSVLIGGFFMLNDLFPMAGDPPIPSKMLISSASVSRDPYEVGVKLGDDEYQAILEYVAAAQPTRKQSLNDHPDESEYYLVLIHESGRKYAYFVYKSASQVYIEIPYYGIYRADDKLLELVIGYYHSGL